MGTFAFLLILIGRWPIVAHDADLWYHLSAGRYIAEHRALPSVAWFSFLPDRRITDFYGLFQLLVYASHRIAGYGGLVVLRTGLFLLIAGLVFGTLLRGAASARARAWGAVAATIVTFALLPRGLILRPHLVTYACLAGFVHLLEYDAKRRFTPIALFVLGLVQVNAHGVCYPVMLAICGAYAAEPLLARIKARSPPSPEERAVLLSTLVPFLTVFFSPLGPRLLPIPFTSTRFARWYVSELSPIGLDFASAPIASLQTLEIAVFILAVVLLVLRLRSRQLRLHHLLLFVAGVGLLSRGIRFTHEFALLSLPLLRAPEGSEIAEAAPRGYARLRLTAAALATLVPASLLFLLLGPRRSWPFSPRGLPAGIARFLESKGEGGRVLNAPAIGGYLEWELDGRFRIAMDMDVPFVFSDSDFFAGMTWPHDASVFRRVVAQYSPDWLCVPLGNPEMAAIVRGTAWTPVFADDGGVLYVDASRHPAMANDWALRTIDPFALEDMAVSRLTPEARAQARLETDRMLAVDDRSLRVTSLASRLALADGDPGRATRLADAIVRVYPERSEGYSLRGDALFATDPAAARAQFAMALPRAEERRPPLRRMRDCDHVLGNHARAYREGLEAVGGFPLDAGSQELYELGVLAMEAKAPDDARMWLDLALLRLAPDQGALGGKIAALLGRPAAGPPP